jgi:hypothetical protein
MTINEDRVRKIHEINSLSTLGDCLKVWKKVTYVRLGVKKIGFCNLTYSLYTVTLTAFTFHLLKII